MERSDLQSEIIFEEVQDISSKSIRSFFKWITIIVFIALIVHILLQRGHVTDFGYVLITLAATFIVLSFLLSLKLTTQIRSDGIYVRFPPLQPSFTAYRWSDIARVYLRDYKALSEYWGWGFRISPQGLGYIVSGNTGIQIILINGNKILITTHRQQEVYDILQKLNVL